MLILVCVRPALPTTHRPLPRLSLIMFTTISFPPLYPPFPQTLSVTLAKPRSREWSLSCQWWTHVWEPVGLLYLAWARDTPTHRAGPAISKKDMEKRVTLIVTWIVSHLSQMNPSQSLVSILAWQFQFSVPILIRRFSRQTTLISTTIGIASQTLHAPFIPPTPPPPPLRPPFMPPLAILPSFPLVP